MCSSDLLERRPLGRPTERDRDATLVRLAILGAAGDEGLVADLKEGGGLEEEGRGGGLRAGRGEGEAGEGGQEGARREEGHAECVLVALGAVWRENKAS